ncbi:MAG: hypothetical protein KAT71_02940 [Gammaproteobacteria bacterium]|nr:hypothetical protein [Gammaproteobacteria bacterium]
MQLFKFLMVVVLMLNLAACASFKSFWGKITGQGQSSTTQSAASVQQIKPAPTSATTNTGASAKNATQKSKPKATKPTSNPIPSEYYPVPSVVHQNMYNSEDDDGSGSSSSS